GLPPKPATTHPAYEIFDHLALEVGSPAEVDAWKERLESHGIQVLGPINHGIIYSIYFRDPVNDIRLELTTPLTPDWNDQREVAQAGLEAWAAAKRRARGDGKDVAATLIEEIKTRRQVRGATK